jgi:hypothetical protein
MVNSSISKLEKNGEYDGRKMGSMILSGLHDCIFCSILSHGIIDG